MNVSRRQFIKQSAAVGLTVGGSAYTAGFLQPRAEGAEQPLRPPGALPEEEFASTCIRCLRCVEACPNQALAPLPPSQSRALAGTPTIKPRRAACMLCMDQDGEYLKCTTACPSGALNVVGKSKDEILQKVHIGTAEIDLGLCYSYNNWSCGACFRACPLAGVAMTVGSWERPQVHPESCVGCGCCERSCIRYPHAIRVTAGARG